MNAHDLLIDEQEQKSQTKKRPLTLNRRPAYVMINDEIIHKVTTGDTTISDARSIAYEYIQKNTEKFLDKNINIKILSLYIEEDKTLETRVELINRKKGDV